MKKITSIFLLMAFVCFFVFPGTAEAQKKWTIMVFLNGDNNLDSAGNNDVEEMMKVGSNDQLDIIVLQDHAGSNNTERHYIKKGSKDTEKVGEIDMGNWQEALNFFKWGVQNHPADHYVFDIWNHGAGWEKKARGEMFKGISYDDDSGNHMTTPHLGLLAKAMKEHIGRNVDIIGYDACLMAMMEVAYETKDYTDYAVFSEETEPGDGWPYDDWLTPLAANPDMSPADVCKKLTETYLASYNGGSQGTSKVTFSALDMSKLDGFIPVLNDFTNALIQNASLNDAFKTAMGATQSFAYAQCKDLIDFARQVKGKVTSSDIMSKADQLIAGVKGSSNSIIIAGGNTGSNVANAEGISIYMPSKSQYDSKKNEYRALKFGIASKWADFIEGLYYPNVPVLSVKTIDIVDENNDGKVSPGELVEFKVTVANEGTKPGSGIKVKLTVEGMNASIESFGEANISEVPGMGEAKAEGLKARISTTCPSSTSVNFTVHVVMGGNEITKDYAVLVRKPFETKSSVLLITKDATDEFSKFYTKALTDAGIGYDLWDVAFEGKISSGLLKKYVGGMVFFNAPGTSDIDTVSQDDLINYLSVGGSLFITGQDIGYKIKDTKFYTDYIHAKYIQDNTGIFNLQGLDTFNGTDLIIANGDGANNQKWPDEIDVVAPAKAILKYNPAGKDDPHFTIDQLSEHADTTKGLNASGTAGLYVTTGVYKIVYFAFGFEAINSAQSRTAVLGKVKSLLYPKTDEKVLFMLSVEKKLSSTRNAGKSSILRNELEQMIEIVETCMLRDINAGNTDTITLLNQSDSAAIRTVRDNLRQNLKNSRSMENHSTYAKALTLLK
ncbi:MAG: clostripain-related cysteine peptidase [Candidatus Wallbacteria bacterium]|nr:clostripain-related cysteine peptidase [Candidatus Wallbacteria bacterium]